MPRSKTAPAEAPADPRQAAREAELEFQESVRVAVDRHNAQVRRDQAKALKEAEK